MFSILKIIFHMLMWEWVLVSIAFDFGFVSDFEVIFVLGLNFNYELFFSISVWFSISNSFSSSTTFSNLELVPHFDFPFSVISNLFPNAWSGEFIFTSTCSRINSRGNLFSRWTDHSSRGEVRESSWNLFSLQISSGIHCDSRLRGFPLSFPSLLFNQGYDRSGLDPAICRDTTDSRLA